MEARLEELVGRLHRLPQEATGIAANVDDEAAVAAAFGVPEGAAQLAGGLAVELGDVDVEDVVDEVAVAVDKVGAAFARDQLARLGEDALDEDLDRGRW